MQEAANAACSLDAPRELPDESAELRSFEAAASATHVVSAEGLIVKVNRAFEIMFGASRQVYLDKHHAMLGAEPMAVGVRLMEGIRADAKGRGVWRGTMRYKRFNGTTIRTRGHVFTLRVGTRCYLVFVQEETLAAAKVHPPLGIRAREQAHDVVC